MRIVYGVSGEGSGHSSRARVVLAHLAERGHEVKVASYDRGHRNLADDFDVLEIEGLHIASVDNRVSVVRTFTENLSRLPEGVAGLRALRRLFDAFRPEVVVTDFEPMTAHLGRRRGLPLLSIDNQHRMRYMRYECPRELTGERLLTETVIRAMVPSPDAAVVTTFKFGEVKNARTFLVPSILRHEVTALEPTAGEHVLVYLTKGFDTLLAELARHAGQRFVVYGAGREGEDGNLRFEAPSRDGFLRDLASSRAVIATAGFTLLTECLHLGKPLLAFPMAGQFEQELNALWLAESGLGANGRGERRGVVRSFLERVPELERALAARPAGTNEALFARLDALLADDAAELRALRELRRRG